MDPLLTSNDFGQLRAFVAVGEARSFSRAADVLGVSPSALSQLVRAFEQRVGVRLLNRTTRSVSLTDAGETLLRRVRPAVGELGAALGQVRRYRERPSGAVRILAPHLAAELYLAPILGSFHQAYPDVILDITVDDVVEAGYDAALRIGELIGRDMIAVRLGPELRQVAVASPSYIDRHGIPQSPRDLITHRCIRWRWPGHTAPYNWEFWENGTWFEVAVDGPLIVSSKDMGVRAAIDGVGIAFAIEPMAAAAITAGHLVPLLQEWSAPFPGHHLCYPQQRQMALALRAFIDHLRADAAKSSSEG